MKKVFLFAAMLAIAASCTVSEIDSIKGTTAPEITASYENNGTKTAIITDDEGVGIIWWKPADEINVFYGTLSTHYTSKNTENATTVAFGTTDIIGSTESASENIWGLYPYDEDAESDGESVTTTIPSSQKGVVGTFDDDLFTSLAHSTSTVMTFYNVLGGIKFSLSRDDIQSITFKGNNDEDIAGKVKLEMDANGKPVAEVTEGVKTITLTPKEGTAFASNTNYYIVLLPTVLSNGFTMTFETETAIGTFEYTTKSIEIKRSVFSKKENIDSYANFENKNLATPFTITSIGTTSISISKNKDSLLPDIFLEYSKNSGNWQQYTIGTTISLSNDETIQFRACNGGNDKFSILSYRDYYYVQSSGSGLITVSGNIMSLLDGSMLRTSLGSARFCSLFLNCSNLVDASQLLLPSKELGYVAYCGMFKGCCNLIAAPSLTATISGDSCYSGMFSGCTSLTNAPELQMTILSESCCSGMFSGCTSLTNAPELPATTLADYCYNGMFSGCTSLTNAPELPATTLASYCYKDMFSGCTSLTNAPKLLATTLANDCYSGMFYGCASLAIAPELPTTTLKGHCYENMFYGCTSLTNAPELPATTLASYCYSGMFYGCTNLTNAPELPATTLKSHCYLNMFRECSNLVSAPELPALTLVDLCYQNMFVDCERLNYVKALFTTKPSSGTTLSWLSGVSPAGIFIKNESAEWDVRGKDGIPDGWDVYEGVIDQPVDLGLSVRWATHNVGATSPEDYGDYFAWGEIEAKTDYSSFSSYKWCDGTYDTLTKYCTDSSYGIVDNKTDLDFDDDVAHIKWGGSWRIPTKEEWDELMDSNNCTWVWTTLNHINGFNITSNITGNSIFLPAAGVYLETVYDAGSFCHYWSSLSDASKSIWALRANLSSPKNIAFLWEVRYTGNSVRPVSD